MKGHCCPPTWRSTAPVHAMTLQQKLLALGITAIAGLLVPSALLIRSGLSEYAALSRFRETTNISLKAYELADNVTRERQLAYQAAGFSGEGTPSAQLARYDESIRASQKSMSELQTLVRTSTARFSPRFDAALQNALRCESTIEPFRQELLVASRSTEREYVASFRTKVLRGYDVVLLTQANFLPVLCLESEDPELVRRIVTQDNVARLQRDFWKAKGLVNTILRDNKLGEIAFGELKTKRLSMDDHISRLRNLADPESARAIEALLGDPDYTRIVAMADQALGMGVKSSDFGALGLSQAAYQSGPFTRVENSYAKLSTAVAASIVDYTDHHLSAARRHLAILAAAVAAMTLCLILAGSFIGQSIAHPLRRLSHALAEAANRGTDSSAVITNSTHGLSKDACEAASALEEISSSVEELSSMTSSSRTYVGELVQLAAKAEHSTTEGSRQMAELVQAMQELHRTNQDVAKILKSIDEIAFQTNILALNAAVEAARAGEAGAGFAVVAEEVRSLATRSAEAARETRTRIESAMAGNSRGAELSRLVGERFSGIADITRDYRRLVEQIDLSSGQNAQGLTQVRESITRIDEITQRNAATAEENASAATEFQKLIGELRSSTAALERMVAAVRETGTAQGTGRAENRPSLPS